MYRLPENLINPLTDQASASVVNPAIASFEFQNHPVRVVTIDGVEYFVAKDVAPILGFKNARQAVRRHVSKQDRDGVTLRDTIGREQTLLAINESGLYALIFGSTLAQAREFKRWITSEVLPSLRQTGSYEMPTEHQLPLLFWRITAMLRGRGAARRRQLNKIVAHRSGEFSLKIGGRWIRRVQAADIPSLPLSHALREGLALSAIRVLKKSDQKTLIH